MRKSSSKKVSPLERDTEPVLTNIPPQPRRTRLNRYQTFEAAEEANRELRRELKDREKVRRVPYKLTRTEPLPPPPPHLYNLRERFERIDRANPEQPRLPLFPEGYPNIPLVMGETQAMEDLPRLKKTDESFSLINEKGGNRKYKTRRNMKSKKYKRNNKSKNTRKYKKSIKKIS